jgi:DNA-binding CsgD family transcriptional regulator
MRNPKARRAPSTESILDAVGTIYDAVLDESAWSVALRRVLSLVDGRSGSVSVINFAQGQVEFFQSFEEDPAWLAPYQEHYLAVNPYRVAMMQRLEGSYLAHEIVPVEEAVKTEFYNDWQKPQGMYWACGLAARSPDGRLALLNLNRPEPWGTYGEDERRLLELLRPHFRRAALLGRHLWSAQGQHLAAQDVLAKLNLGVVLIGEDERVHMINPPAEELIASCRALRLAQGVLRATSAEEAGPLEDLVRRAVRTGKGQGLDPGGVILLHDPSAGEPLPVLVMPLRGAPRGFGVSGHYACAAVFLSLPGQAPPTTHEVLRALYGLTPAESALTLQLVSGQSVQEAAQFLRIRRATARNQLKAVFQKTGTHRQGELIRLVMSLPTSAVRAR